MRILHVVGSLAREWGGLSLFVAEIAAEQSLQGHDVRILTQGHSGAPESWPCGRAEQITGNPGDLTGESDVVHVHGLWLPFYHRAVIAARRGGRGPVISSHGMLEPGALRFSRWKKRIAWATFQRGDLTAAPLLHTTTPVETETLRGKGLAGPVIEVAPGVRELPQFDRALGPERVALFIGRIHPMKGIDLLMNAWAAVKPAGWKLQLAGPDEDGYRARVERMISEVGLGGCIEWLGPIFGEDKERAMAEAELLVVPSLSENFGIVVAEGMAAGLPVITTTGTPWACLEQERCGWWVPATRGSIAEALQAACGMDRESLAAMGARGRAVALSRFSWQRGARDLVDAYEWVVGGGERPACVATGNTPNPCPVPKMIAALDTPAAPRPDPRIKRVVFWQNIPSFHQSALVRALAERPGLEVWFAHEEDLPQERRAMGWQVPDFGRAHLVDSRQAEVWDSLTGMDHEETVHAFGGYFLLPSAYAAFRKLRHAPCRRVWTTEAFDFHGWRGQVRLWRARWHVWREARQGFDRVFAMGRLGVDFFGRAGFPRRRIREFGYLVEPGAAVEFEPHSETHPHRFLVVGQMISRKGVDLVLLALARMARWNWQLELIGDGPQRGRFESMAADLGISERCFFRGNLPNWQTVAAMRTADTLVLASRWDGWGAVVNEALMVGTRVVVSEACGAASLIVDARCGRTFPRGDIRALSETLDVEAAPRPGNAERVALAEWAGRALSGEALAGYFLKEISGEMGVAPPPWRTMIAREAVHPE